MTKTGHQKFWRMKTKQFSWEKTTLEKFCMESENFSEIGGKSETEGEMHHCLWGDGHPADNRHKNRWSSFFTLYSSSSQPLQTQRPLLSWFSNHHWKLFRWCTAADLISLIMLPYKFIKNYNTSAYMTILLNIMQLFFIHSRLASILLYPLVIAPSSFLLNNFSILCAVP